jgi:hypothetical protein
MKVGPRRTDSSKSGVILEIVTKWRDYLAGSSNGDDQDLASYMVGAVLEADVDIEILHKVEPLLPAVFDVLGSLEASLVPDDERPQLWAQVRAGVTHLERKYTPPAKP